jgi:hypothetical protein
MNLADLLSVPTGGFDVVPGYADDYPNIKVMGLTQPAIWLGDYAGKGEPIIVGIIRKPDAPAQCLVLGRVGVPFPVEGEVAAAPPGSDTLTVTAGSAEYTVTFLDSYSPTVGDRVALSWQGSLGRALGKVGVTPSVVVNGTATPPPPGAATAGTLPVPTVDSGTWSGGAYGWNARYGQNVYQGDGSAWGGPSTNAGSWFYGANASQLQGATITGVEFNLPARKSAGSSGSPATVHLYLHNSPTRPGGDVTRVAGPVDVVVQPNSRGGFVSLPAGWGSTLIAGGGISITGNPYLGLSGRGEQPDSGQLKLSWQR